MAHSIPCERNGSCCRPGRRSRRRQWLPGRLRTVARPRAFLQIEIEAPSPGVYQVVVSAYNVPDGPQDFALVVTGDFVELVSCDSVDVKTQSPSDLLRTQSPDSSRSPTERTEPPYAFATFNPHARAHVAVAASPSPRSHLGEGSKVCDLAARLLLRLTSHRGRCSIQTGRTPLPLQRIPACKPTIDVNR